MELTNEQEMAADSKANNLLVIAYAGTGKTSMLVEYAKRRPDKRLHYLAFNRSIKEEAILKFPSNVRCVTTHGLAFATHGKFYQAKLGNPKAYHLARAMSLDMLSAGKVLGVILNYLISPDTQITEVHAIPVTSSTSTSAIGNLIDYARRGWAMIIDTNNSVPMPHDGYLKLYQLSRPVIDTGIILFDEAQDANPVTLAIVASQNVNKVFVGDPYQAIYSFRGAVDALASIDADESLFLTSSFRFGEGIAQVATALLHDWRGALKPVQGRGQYASTFTVNKAYPHAILARSNGKIFAEAVSLVKNKTPFGFSGGVDGYRFDQILDTYRLFSGHRSEMKDPFLASFNDFAGMRLYADEVDDRELKALVNVVDEYEHKIPTLIGEIKCRAISHLTGQEVVLSTAHKAKGLEYMDVVLTDDFTDLKPRHNDEGQKENPKPEEINIFYVALTRAMRGLALPNAIKEWLIESGRGDLLKMVPQGQPETLIVAKELVPLVPSPQSVPVIAKVFNPLAASQSATPVVVVRQPASLSASKAFIGLNQRFRMLDAQFDELEQFVSGINPEMAAMVVNYLRSKAEKFGLPKKSIMEKCESKIANG